MNYRVKRDDQEFGPYSLSDLQQYVQSGHILPQDLAQSEGMSEWVPISQILGDIPIPPSIQVGAYGGMDPNASAPQLVPLPPNLPWQVLLITYLSLFPFPLLKTLSFIVIVWSFVEAYWALKLSGRNTALVLVSMRLAGLITNTTLARIGAASGTKTFAGLGGILLLAGAICGIVAAFKIRDAMEEYYNTVENIGLSMSGVMIFFFNVIYIQYFVNRIARWKKTGELN